MAERGITLREERYERNSYYLWARLRDDGALVIEGRDSGAAAEQFWGSQEYEWEIAVSPEHLPRLAEALGGAAGECDPLELIAARYREDERYGSRSFLEEQGIPFHFRSRVGD